MPDNNFLHFFQSKPFVAVILIIFGLALLAGVFSLGVMVGYRKAGFSYAWGENYQRNFGGPRGGFFQAFNEDFTEGHGVFGQIIKIDGSTLVIKGQDNVEKIVLIKDDTVIRRLTETVKISELKIDDNVVVIGNPNSSGQIEAKFIRLLPPLETPNATSTSGK